MANETATLGKTGKFGDLKRRLMFLLGALVVYRIGAHIPVPGIDPVRLVPVLHFDGTPITARFVEQAITKHVHALAVAPRRERA